MPESINDERRARFERMYADYYENVLAYAMRRTPREHADEIVAETFLVMWRRLEQVPRDPLP